MTGRLSLMQGRALHVAHAEAVNAHSTPAYKLVVGVDAPLHFRLGSRTGSARVALIPPGVSHEMRCPGTAVAFFKAAGTALTPFRLEHVGMLLPDPSTDEALCCLAGELVASSVSPAHDAHFVDAAYARMSLVGAKSPESRVTATLDTLSEQPDLPMTALSARVHLSLERLRHLVVAQTGTPLRAHRLFARTLLAIEHVLSGRSLATAAANAGFSDQAHFSRSFSRSFGRPPSSMPDRVHLMQPWAQREER